nr:tyrosine-protein kinase, non-receptor Jak2 [Tanacetum cinerariifolium]
ETAVAVPGCVSYVTALLCYRIVFYGGQFWNKLVSCFAWIGGRCSSKKD